MTRKHFKAIADCVRQVPNTATRFNLTEDLCEMFRSFNPRFDSNRFRRACGFETERNA